MSAVKRQALFADLVYNEAGEIVEVVDIGGVAHYAVPDAGFLRHVEALEVDRQIVEALQERIKGMQDAIVDGMINMMGSESLFTRPMLQQAIDQMDRILEPGAVDVDQFRTAMWMTKFRATVNVHGDVVDLDVPGLEGEPE